MERMMSMWRRDSDQVIIPQYVSNQTAAQPERQETAVNTIPDDDNNLEKRKTRRTSSPLSHYFPRLESSIPRRLTSRWMISPKGTLYDEPQAVDGAANQPIQDPMAAKTMVGSGEPGSGHVLDIYPTVAKHMRRWNKPASIPVAHIPIPAGSLAMNYRMDGLPRGWTMYIHPEGKPYYHREAMEPEDLSQDTPLYDEGKEVCVPLPMVTDSDPRDPVVRKTLEHAHFLARVKIFDEKIELPKCCELFVELYPEDETDLRPYAGYYLADHDNQVIFWAESTTTRDIGCLRVNPKVFANQHLRLQLTAQYWLHVECYPIDPDATPEIKDAHYAKIKVASDNLTNQLTFMCLDIATSPTSTSMWTESQCQFFLSMLRNGRKTWLVARLTALVGDWQFQNLYGHPAARLDRYHSYEVDVASITPDKATEEKDAPEGEPVCPMGPEPPETLVERIKLFYQFVRAVILRLTCVLLFDAPAAHYNALEKVWVDKIVNKGRFQILMDRTIKDWTDVSILSTVLWTANMAFLAIPFPVIGPQQQAQQTGIQEVMRIGMVTASLASTVFSVGSIAISLLHIRKHRMERTAEESCNYLETQQHAVFGHRPLAIIWALPFAFLMWSVLAFSAAVILFAIMAAGDVTKYLLVALSAFIVAWIVLCVWYFWKRETHHEDGLNPRFKMIFTNWTWEWRSSPLPAHRQGSKRENSK